MSVPQPSPSALVFNHHRLMGRALNACPLLLADARAVVAAWHGAEPVPPFAEEWRIVLGLPASEVATLIADRTEASAHLRDTSPFALSAMPPLRPAQVDRMWRLATWRATRILRPDEYRAYAGHLRGLSSDDRRLRFSAFERDAWIDDYVGGIGGHGVVIAHVGDDLILDAAAHVALYGTGDSAVAEIGLSVLPQARGHGLGHELVERGALWAANHGAHALYMLFLTENTAMSRLARDHGAHLERCGTQVEAEIDLPQASAATIALDVVENQLGEWDATVKRTLAGAPLPDQEAVRATESDLRRLDRLAQLAGTASIEAYILGLRYALLRLGLSSDRHPAALARVRARLESSAEGRGETRAFLRGLPDGAKLAA